MANVKRGRHRSMKILTWADPKQIKRVDNLGERLDRTRPSLFEEALNLLLQFHKGG